MNNLEQIVCQYYKDKNGNPMSYHIRRKHQISPKNYQIQLDGIPDEYRGIEVVEPNGLYRVYNADEITENSYWVRDDGNVFFHESRACQNVMLDYYSIGLPVVGAGRIYTLLDEEGNVIETLEDILKKGKTVVEALKTMSDVIITIDKLKTSIYEGIKVINTLDTTIDEGYKLLAKLNAVDYVQKPEFNKTISDINKKIDESVLDVNEKISKDNQLLNNLIKSKRIEINLKEPPLYSSLKPCKMDGVNDDTINLQAIHDYIVTHYKKGTIYIPSGVLRITDTFNWNVNIVKIKCDGEIFANINDKNKYAINCISQEGGYDEKYTKNTLKNEGIILYGKSYGGSCNGIAFKNNGNKLGVSRVTFNNCSFYNFNISLTLSEKSYLNCFNNCSFYASNIGINVEGGDDCGENYEFIGCSVFNNKQGIVIDNEFSTTFFRGTSIDYNTDGIIILKKGKIFLDNCHIEQRESDYKNIIPFIMENSDGNTMNFNLCYIMFNGNGSKDFPQKQYVFDNKYNNNPFSGIYLNNCFLQGCRTRSGFLFTDSGINKIEKTQTYQWDNITCFINQLDNMIIDGKVFNADIKYHTDFRKTQDGQNIDIVPAFHVFGQDNHAIGLIKKTDTKTFGEASFLIRRKNFENIILNAKLDIKSNKPNTFDLYFGTCNLDKDGNMVNKEYINRRGLLGCNIIPQTFYIYPDQHQARITNTTNDYIFISINLFNTDKDVVIYLKNIFLNNI